MNTIDRIVVTILFMGAILRPTEIIKVEDSWIYGFAIVATWLLWEGMIIIFYYKRKPLVVDKERIL